MDTPSVIEEWAGGLLAKLTPAARRRLLTEMARELRQAQQRRIAAQRAPDGSAYVPRKTRRESKHLRDKVGRVKRGAMFRKLRTVRYLKIEIDDARLAIGFDNRLSRIARVHQEGQTAPVEANGPSVRYPVRVVLGFASSDRERIRDRLLEHVRS
jgi:phage virion morphogenesis protein